MVIGAVTQRMIEHYRHADEIAPDPRDAAQARPLRLRTSHQQLVVASHHRDESGDDGGGLRVRKGAVGWVISVHDSGGASATTLGFKPNQT